METQLKAERITIWMVSKNVSLSAEALNYPLDVFLSLTQENYTNYITS